MVCAACCHTALIFALMHLYNFFIVSVQSFSILFEKSGIDKPTEGFTIPACPSHMCFSFVINMGDTEGTSSSKMLCLMFV